MVSMLHFPPESSEQRKVLVSWKEIASSLDRAERTVKRWEHERGLPVHRVPGGERGSVFAYRDELEDWLKGKSRELEADDPVLSTPAAGPSAGQTTGDSSTQFGVSQSIRESVTPTAGHRWNVDLARVAAWITPLALTAA